MIVVSDPLLKNMAQMPFIEGNDEVQTFSTDCAHYAHAERIRLRRANGRFENREPHRRKGGGHLLSKSCLYRG